MKWVPPGWRSVRAFVRDRVTAFAGIANALLATALRPKVGRTLAVLFFLSVIGVAAHAATMSASVTLSAPPNYLNLVGYWPLDSATTNFANNTTQDLSGYNNTGTLVNMTSKNLVIPGQVGQAMSFNGTSQYVSVGNPNWYGTAWTWSGWVKLNAYPGTSAGESIISDGTGFNGNGAYMNVYNTSGTPQLFITVHTSQAIDIAQFPLNSWQFVVGVINGPNMYLYRNGALVGSNSALSGASAPTTYPMEIGQYSPGNPLQYWNGSIDDVRIYSRALSATEIQNMYTATK